MKDIKEIISEVKSIMTYLRGEVLKKSSEENLIGVTKRINKSRAELEELELSYSKLLANQKPDNLPADWETQLADKKQLEIKLNAAQTDLSKEQQTRQQTESKIQQAEQFGLTDWDNLTNQIGSETLASLLERPKKSELEEIRKERDKRPNITIEEYNRLQSNQKPFDYDSVKDELNKWKNALGNQNLEQVQNKISELEKRPTTGQLDELVKKNTQLQEQNQQLQQQLDNSVNKELESTFPELSNEKEVNRIRGGIETKLEEINNIKIAELNDEEFTKWCDEFKEIKNWAFTGNKEQREASRSKYSELKKITNKLGLEVHLRKWKRIINDDLNDIDNEEKDWQLKLSRFELKGVDYIDFARTLREKTSKEEIDEFGSKVVGKINKQRQIHLDLIELIAEGKKIFESKNVKEAEKFFNYLEYFQKLAEKMEEEEEIFYSKINEITKLKNSMELLIQQAQTVQPSK